MNAKTIFVLTAAVASVTALCDDSEALKQAYLNGAMSKVVYRLVDDVGEPVSNACAHIWYRSFGLPAENADWKAMSDGEGRFVAEHRTNERLSVHVSKDGYYSSRDVVSYFDTKRNSVVDGKWQPYGAEKTIVLKKIRNPVKSASVRPEERLKVPAYDVWIGFDCERGVFTPPYGNGVHADMTFRFKKKDKGRTDYHMTMEVSFDSSPFAGAYVMRKDMNSDFKYAYGAETNKTFLRKFTYSYDRFPGRPPAYPSRLADDQYLVFRVRTEVDSSGKLISARYGVLSGPLEFVGPAGVCLDGLFLNPTPNDTNLEDEATARYSQLLLRQQRSREANHDANLERKRRATPRP